MTKKLLDWYKVPLTKRHVAELRKKLAIARGVLENVSAAREECSIQYRNEDSVDMPTTKELRRVLKRTADD